MKKYYLSTPRLVYLALFLFLYSSSSTAQSWQQLSSPPFQTDHSYGFGYEGKAFVIQGNAGNPLWQYTPDTDSWEQIGDFPGPSRGFAVGDEWDGKYYYGFGTLGGTVLNDLWVFDPVDQSFTELPSCPCTPRYHPAFIAHNDKIMMGTGSSGNGNLEDWWEYDMITQVWTQKQNIPGGARHHPFFFSNENSVFLGGGHRDTWFEYDLTTEVLTPIDNTPLGRVAGSQFQYDGKGFLLAGDNTAHDHIPDSETFMFYDPQLGEWGYLPPLPEGSRWASSSFIIDDILYHFDGVDYDDGSSSMWKFDLTTLDCLSPGNLNANNLGETSAELSWISYAGTSNLRWRKANTSDWTNVPNAQPVFTLENLEPCEEYEFQLLSLCGADTTYSEISTFQSKGCGSCIDLEYCDAQQFFNNNNAFISKVEINSYINTSGENTMGYENFTVPNPEEIMIGGDFTLTVEVSESNAGTKLKVWIDLDQDGNFENNEILVDESISGNEITTNVSVPSSATIGVSRIRISYGHPSNQNANINLTACSTANSQFIDGEAEDYCILLVESTSTEDELNAAINLVAFPNPFTNTVHLKGEFPTGKKYQLKVLDIMGRTINTIDNFSLSDEIDLSDVSKGVYFLQIENENTSYKVKLVKQN